MEIVNYLKRRTLNQSLALMAKLSDKNIIRITGALEATTSRVHKSKIAFVKKLYEKKHPALALTKRFMTELNRNSREKFINNFILNELLENGAKRERALKEGSAPLFAVLISPSMRCNLRCKGCYAQNYGKNDDLPFKDFDRLISEAKELGVTMFAILGGEPFIREDIFDIFEKHADSYFQVYSNGTMINERIAKKLVDAGNVLVDFSVEGFEKDNDSRRGAGVFRKVMSAMDLMRDYRLPFGYSVCVTRQNAGTVMSDGFVDMMVSKGAMIGWYFLYMPVCGDKNTELMPTPEQRNMLRKRRDTIRSQKPLFIVDFWNDAPYVGGCIAARFYAHVTNYGDVEPCIFTHFSQANIKKVPLKKAVNCPLFKEIRSRQPYGHNLLMPCMLIDHPEVFREIHAKTNAKPTHPAATTLIEDLRAELDKYSSDVRDIYDKVWEETKDRYPSTCLPKNKAGFGAGIKTELISGGKKE